MSQKTIDTRILFVATLAAFISAGSVRADDVTITVEANNWIGEGDFHDHLNWSSGGVLGGDALPLTGAPTTIGPTPSFINNVFQGFRVPGGLAIAGSDFVSTDHLRMLAWDGPSTLEISGGTVSFPTASIGIRAEDYSYGNQVSYNPAGLVQPTTISLKGGTLSDQNRSGWNLFNDATVIYWAGVFDVHTEIPILENRGDLTLNETGGPRLVNNLRNFSGSVFSVAEGRIEIDQTVVNEGTITFLSDPSSDATLRLGADVSLTGGGEVILVDEKSLIDGGTFTNGDNTIRGTGKIVTGFVNQGTIRVEGGQLEIEESIDNTGGVIELAPDGTLVGLTSRISGGTITGESGGALAELDELSGVILQGAITYGAGETTETTIGGTITNDGSLTFAQDGSDDVNGPDQRFHLPTGESATIAGTGEMIFSSAETGLSGSRSNFGGSGPLTNGPDHTIRGHGTLVSLGQLINEGTIRAEGGTLTLSSTHIEGFGDGTIEIASDGKLLGKGTYGGTIGNGTIHGETGAIMDDIDELQDVILTGQLTYGAGEATETTIGGTITNDGSLTFAQGESDDVNGPDQRFHLPTGESATIAGTGEMIFSSAETGLSGSRSNFGGSGPLTNGPDHTIRGHGTLVSLGQLINEGTIRAEGGTLTLSSTHIEGFGDGTIEIASDGKLFGEGTYGGTIANGTIHGETGAIMDDIDELQDVILTGQLTHGAGEATETTIGGTITNDGSLTFAQDGSDDVNGPDQRFHLPTGESATIAGTGEMIFSSAETGLSGSRSNFGGSGPLTNGPDHTIRGHGTLVSLGQLINEGTIRAEGGTLTLSSTHIEGSGGGTIEVASDGKLLGEGTFGGTIANGTIHGEAGAIMDDIDELQDVILTGELTYGAGASSSTELVGTLRNNGMLTFLQDQIDDLGAIDQQLEVLSTATVGGGGEIVLTGPDSGFEGTGSGAGLTNDAGHTIRGRGRFDNLDVVNHGTIRAEDGELHFGEDLVQTEGLIHIAAGSEISVRDRCEIVGGVMSGAGTITGDVDNESGVASPGTSPGTLTIDGNYNQGVNASLKIEIGGTAAGQTDLLAVTGGAALQGTLDLRLFEGFVPTADDTFTVLTCGALSGAFANGADGTRVATADGRGTFLITYGANAIELSDFQTTDPFEVLSQQNAMSDADGDGVALVDEFLFGGSPTSPDSGETFDMTGSLGGAELMAEDGALDLDPGSEYVVFDLRVRRDRKGIILSPMVSMDLSFADAPAVDLLQVGSATRDGDFDILRYVIAGQETELPPNKAFLRLNIDFSMLSEF